MVYGKVLRWHAKVRRRRQCAIVIQSGARGMLARLKVKRLKAVPMPEPVVEPVIEPEYVQVVAYSWMLHTARGGESAASPAGLLQWMIRNGLLIYCEEDAFWRAGKLIDYLLSLCQGMGSRDDDNVRGESHHEMELMKWCPCDDDKSGDNSTSMPLPSSESWHGEMRLPFLGGELALWERSESKHELELIISVDVQEQLGFISVVSRKFHHRIVLLGSLSDLTAVEVAIHSPHVNVMHEESLLQDQTEGDVHRFVLHVPTPMPTPPPTPPRPITPEPIVLPDPTPVPSPEPTPPPSPLPEPEPIDYDTPAVVIQTAWSAYWRRQQAVRRIQRTWRRGQRLALWQDLVYSLLHLMNISATIMQCMIRKRIACKRYAIKYDEEYRPYGHDFDEDEAENWKAFGLGLGPQAEGSLVGIMAYGADTFIRHDSTAAHPTTFAKSMPLGTICNPCIEALTMLQPFLPPTAMPSNILLPQQHSLLVHMDKLGGGVLVGDRLLHTSLATHQLPSQVMAICDSSTACALAHPSLSENEAARQLHSTVADLYTKTMANFTHGPVEDVGLPPAYKHLIQKDWRYQEIVAEHAQKGKS